MAIHSDGGFDFIKKWKFIKNAFSYKAEYLEDTYFNFDTKIMKNFSDYGMALSKEMARYYDMDEYSILWIRWNFKTN